MATHGHQVAIRPECVQARVEVRHWYSFLFHFLKLQRVIWRQKRRKTYEIFRFPKSRIDFCLKIATFFLQSNNMRFNQIILWDNSCHLTWFNPKNFCQICITCFVSFVIWVPVGTKKNCQWRGYFTLSWRGIGVSFQLAIIAYRYNLIDYDIATAQNWLDIAKAVLYCHNPTSGEMFLNWESQLIKKIRTVGDW